MCNKDNRMWFDLCCILLSGASDAITVSNRLLTVLDTRECEIVRDDDRMRGWVTFSLHTRTPLSLEPMSDV